MKPPCRKSCAGKSSDVVRFDLEPLLQGQTRTAKLKRVSNSFIIDPRVLQCETNLQATRRILWVGNLGCQI